MVHKEVPMSELFSERQKAYQEVKDRGGSDMAALVSAINIIPETNKRLTKNKKGNKIKQNKKEGLKI
jgi:hypothetical protein|tara:strand:+ start:2316 stop:2516 length:201 start_codon:yes stop_codon:yes gene_type:complete